MTAARAERTVALVVGGALALVFVVLAGISVTGWTVGTVTHRDHRVIPGAANVSVAASGRADVIVVPSAGPRVTVDTAVRGSFRTPRLRLSVRDGVVHVAGGCGWTWFGHCRATVTVRVPAGRAATVDTDAGDVVVSAVSGPVHVRTGAGDVSAADLSGPADLHTSSGDVEAHHLTGRVTLSSDSGDVVGEDLDSATVRASSGSGDVVLVFSSAPAVAGAETGSGDVSLLVPRGPAYTVQAETSSGDRTVGVTRRKGSGHRLRARTGSGDVVVAYNRG
jgi:hypothetical protein